MPHLRNLMELPIRSLRLRLITSFALALCLYLYVLPVVAGDQATPQSERSARTEILWDQYGVPHIYGDDVPSVLRGYGYAQMENHAELLLQLIAAARGRSAEYFGPGESNQNVDNDIRVRTFGIPQRALHWYMTGGSEQRHLLDAFVSGMNEHAATHRDSLAPRFLRVLPVTAADILAVAQKTMHLTIMADASGVQQLMHEWQVGDVPDSAALARRMTQHLNGSNGWALGPQRTRSGNAMLLGNPHLPWGVNQPEPGFGDMQWFEAHLVTPTLNAHGAAMVGSPFIAIGFNDDLGWTHTANGLKNVDLYELTLVNGGYFYEGQVLPLRRRQEQILILQSGGRLQKQSFEVASSIHGPIVAQRDNKALAMRVAGLDASAVVTQYWDMIRARNLREFNQASSRLQIPYFNILYADRHGDILYLFGGRQPARSGGEYSDWLGILPGDRASALWTRTLTWDELPKTINPAGGFVQNCNDSPWTATFPQAISPSRYPAYITDQQMSLRAQHSALFLTSKPRFTFDELLAGKMSTRLELATRVLPDLIAAANAAGDPIAIAAAAVLQAWDGTSDATSRGGALFELWFAMLATPEAGEPGPIYKIDWSAQQPLTTPRGLADPARAVRALVAAANRLQQQAGAVDVPWGETHRLTLVGWDPDYTTPTPLLNLPVSGSDSSDLGGLRIVWFTQSNGLQQLAVGGDGYVQLVEFADTGSRAQTLLTYGNASRPGSAHITDQLRFFSEKRLRPVPRSRDEVEAQSVRRESLQARRRPAEPGIAQ